MKFRLSQTDINRGKLVDPGLWYPLTVLKVYDESAKDGQSTNTKVDMIIRKSNISANLFEGIVVTRTFSEKAPGFIIPYLAAFDIPVKVDEEYDLKPTEGRDLEGFITHREYQNQKYNDVTDFRPSK